MLYRVLERRAVIPHLLWLRLVEVCIFCLCVLSPLQVAAVYKDPSVGNLINIVIVKLIVVHNEQVSAALAFHSPGACRCLWPGPCSGGGRDSASPVSLNPAEGRSREYKRYHSAAARHLQMRLGKRGLVALGFAKGANY